MLNGARRPRRSSGLGALCRVLGAYVRMAKRAAKDDPHIFGPHASQYLRETLEFDAFYRELGPAMTKVYGPAAPGEPRPGHGLWTDRYFYRPEDKRRFLKWFREKHPSR
jgi:hypothetical protein